MAQWILKVNILILHLWSLTNWKPVSTIGQDAPSQLYLYAKFSYRGLVRQNNSVFFLLTFSVVYWHWQIGSITQSFSEFRVWILKICQRCKASLTYWLSDLVTFNEFLWNCLSRKSEEISTGSNTDISSTNGAETSLIWNPV